MVDLNLKLNMTLTSEPSNDEEYKPGPLGDGFVNEMNKASQPIKTILHAKENKSKDTIKSPKTPTNFESSVNDPNQAGTSSQSNHPLKTARSPVATNKIVPNDLNINTTPIRPLMVSPTSVLSEKPANIASPERKIDQNDPQKSPVQIISPNKVLTTSQTIKPPTTSTSDVSLGKNAKKNANKRAKKAQKNAPNNQENKVNNETIPELSKEIVEKTVENDSSHLSCIPPPTETTSAGLVLGKNAKKKAKKAQNTRSNASENTLTNIETASNQAGTSIDPSGNASDVKTYPILDILIEDIPEFHDNCIFYGQKEKRHELYVGADGKTLVSRLNLNTRNLRI
jgi:hypothetical protein